MAKILIVEDDENTLEFLKPELKHEGFDVCTAMDGKIALQVFESENPDLILLDVMLPEINGFEVLRRIRKISNVPIIMVTARDESFDKINGLNGGADDYIAKPFLIEELLARINAVLRRYDNSRKSSNDNEIFAGEITLNKKSKTAFVNGNLLDLSKTEFLLLSFFMENKGSVLSREQIADGVWGENHEMDMNGIDVYLNYLRTKIRKHTNVEYIKNQRGLGFIMEG